MEFLEPVPTLPTFRFLIMPQNLHRWLSAELNLFCVHCDIDLGLIILQSVTKPHLIQHRVLIMFANSYTSKIIHSNGLQIVFYPLKYENDITSTRLFLVSM